VVLPADVKVIDTLVTLPRPDAEHPAGYMFKDTPRVAADELLPEMDRFGVERALLPVVRDEPVAPTLLRSRPDRFLGCYQLEPDRGVAGVRELRRSVEELGVVAAGAFPAGTVPQVGIDDRTWFPLYAACAELGIPVFVNIGVPGPRWPARVQHPMLLETVLDHFPELTVVTRHGGEPWVRETICLMRSWPNLHYSTSAFAPRYYPAEIVEFANADGADRVLYAGYFPSGLSLERIFGELAGLPLYDAVWPKFLRTNALRVLHLD
jgi:predicted TIM-barrel fold metal-dependent hydrolase